MPENLKDFVITAQKKPPGVGGHSLSKSTFPRLPRKVQMLGSAATTSLCGCRSGADDADVPRLMRFFFSISA